MSRLCIFGRAVLSRAVLGSAALGLGVVGGCAPPNLDEGFTVVEHFADASGEDANAHFVEVMDSADATLRVALPFFEDPALADAFVDALDRGVDGRLVLDIDQIDDAGVVQLETLGVTCMEAEEALVHRLAGEEPPCILADDGVDYFDFANNVAVVVPSSAIWMTHAFAVADDVHFVRSSRAGDLAQGVRLSSVGHSEDLGDDLSREHQQLFGGTDASTLTAFSSSAKSVTDNRWLYPTQSRVSMEMWFGPQERLIKRIIDATYRARSSVYVLTDDFVDVNLARALDQKGADGFKMIAVVGPNFGTTRPELSRTFLSADNIEKYRISEGVEHVPTMVLVDYTEDQTGSQPMTQAFVLSHDIAATTRYFGGGSAVEVLEQSDQLMDGNLMVLDDFSHDPLNESTEIGTIYDIIEDHFAMAEEL